jgi:fatty-acyl-CoA synthase
MTDDLRGAEHNLWTIFEAVAHKVDSHDAIVFGPTRRSYAELASRARHFAGFLSSHGFGCQIPRDQLSPWQIGQDVVALYLYNGLEYLEAMLGSFAARTVPANVNYRYTADELVYLFNDSQPATIVFHARFAPTLAEALPRLQRHPLLVQVADGSSGPFLPGAVDYEEVIDGAAVAPVEPVGGELEPEDIYLLYTGGTTGLPKGTLWRQADIFDAALGGPLSGLSLKGIADAAVEHEPSSVMPLAPFMHGAAQWIGLSALLAGEAVVISTMVDHLDPSDVWAAVQGESVSKMFMAGEAFARPLLDELEVGHYDVSSLQLILIGGAITTPETKQRILNLIPRARVADIAGASETGNLLSAVSSSGRITEAGVFRPGPTTVVLDVDRKRVLEPAHTGVGWVAKSGFIPLGYLGDQPRTEATFPTLADGIRYVVPGDRALLRADGMVSLLGRESVTINSGGEKIFAEEVERAVLRVPGVRDALVCGRPNSQWGQEVIAIVSYYPGAALSETELINSVTGIARFKRPKMIIAMDQIERSPSGKADYAWASRVLSKPGYPHAKGTGPIRSGHSDEGDGVDASLSPVEHPTPSSASGLPPMSATLTSPDPVLDAGTTSSGPTSDS